MKSILAAVDFSKVTDLILEQAATMAKALDAKLWILHATSDETQAMAYESSQFTDYAPEFVNLPGDVQMARNICADEFKREHSQLLGMSSKLREKGADTQAMLLKGEPWKVIVEKALEVEAGIIVLGSHGHGLLHKALLGSVSETVLHHAPCSIMIVPGNNNA